MSKTNCVCSKQNTCLGWKRIKLNPKHQCKNISNFKSSLFDYLFLSGTSYGFSQLLLESQCGLKTMLLYLLSKSYQQLEKFKKKSANLRHIQAGSLDRLDKQIVDQASDVPSIIFFRLFIDLGHSKLFTFIFVFFLKK